MNTRYIVKHRRRREGRTNYTKRVKLLISQSPVVRFRKGSKNIIAQITAFDQKGDKTVLYANSSELKNHGWTLSRKNIPAAYLTGLLLAKKNKNKLGEIIADFGIKKPSKGSASYAFLKGVLDGGLNVICSKDPFPSEDRISGKHISSYSSGKHQKTQFSKTPGTAGIEKLFIEVKNKIMKG